MKKGAGSSKVLSPVIRAKPDLTPDDDAGENSEPQSHEPAAEMDSTGAETSVSEKDKICVNLADSISNGFCKEDGEDVNASIAKSDSSSAVDPDVVVSSSNLQRKNGNMSAAAGCGDSSKTESESNSEVTESCASGSVLCNEASGSHADVEPGSSSSTSEVHN